MRLFCIFIAFFAFSCVKNQKTDIEITKSKIISAMKAKNYNVLTGENELNIVGIRSLKSNPDKFEEKLALFFTKNNKEHFILYPITTLPNSYYLKNPINPKGTAILVEGQYSDWKTYIRGSGKYHALMQPDLIPVYRDNNKDKKIDLDPTTIESGYFEIELHRFNEDISVRKQSAGCQVFRNNDDYFGFMEAVRESIADGKEITYTLINDEDLLQTQ